MFGILLPAAPHAPAGAARPARLHGQLPYRARPDSGSPILLLDESTSALDDNTERHLLENLRELTDRTVIIVTHRKAALSVCDRILRFDESGVRDVKR